MRVGLYLGADWIVGVIVTRHAILWHNDTRRNRDTTLEAQLIALFHDAPREQYTRPSLFVALGPSVAQMKRLRGLPPIDDPKVLRQLIEGSPSRFFLFPSDALVCADPARCGKDWWAAVADAKTILALDTACKGLGWRRGGIRPVAMVLDRVFQSRPVSTSIVWIDGAVALTVGYDDDRVATTRRTAPPDGEPTVPPARLDSVLEKLGVDAWRFAGAYGAARARKSPPLAVPWPNERAGTSRRGAVRFASVALVIIGMIATLISPDIAAARARFQSERELGALRVDVALVAKDRAALDRQVSALRQIRTFATSRQLLTPMLSAISLQLPESTAITALRIDTIGGTMVTLSPSGTALVSALSTTPGVETLQLSAPITREMIGLLELQRTAVRFRFQRRGRQSQVRKP